jgi:hypothetical protein
MLQRYMDRCRSFRPFLILPLLLLIAPGGLWSQTSTGGIVGTITDQSGAIVPNAAITLTSDAKGSSQSLSTTSN